MSNSNKIGNAFFERGSWHHRFKVLNEDYTTSYNKKGGFATPEEAEESYEKYKEEYEQQLTKHHLNIDKEVYFSNYLIYWFENVFKERNPDNNYALGVAYVIYNLIVPALRQEESRNDIKLRLLNTTYLDSILEEVARTTSSAGNKCKEVLSIALKDAENNKYIVGNPLEGTKKYKRKAPKITILSKKELKKLLEVAQFDNWYLEILLAVFCGLRKGEIMGLKFDDFDLENNIIRIRRQLVNDPVLAEKMEVKKVEVEKYVLVEKPPKKDSYRNLRVPQVIIKELLKRKEDYEAYKGVNEEFCDLDYISFNRDTGKPQLPTSFNNYLYRKCPKISIPKISVHGLRHMFATILIERGVPLVKIAALLGHASPNTTFEIYCGIMEERQKILAFINNTFSPELVKEVV